MNRIAVIVSVTLLVAVAIAQIPRTTPNVNRNAQLGQVGRYQILNVDQEFEGSPNGPEKERLVLRIDTATGAVDEWFTGKAQDGLVYDEWVPTGYFPMKR